MPFRVAPDADDHLGDALGDFMETVLVEIEANAFRLVPTDTFALQRSLRHEKNVDGAVASGAVGSDLDYSSVVELGRRDLPAYPIQPYLKPALYQTRGVRP